MEQRNNDRIKLMATIVDRGRGPKVVDLYRAQQLHFNYACLGRGTAHSRMLDTLGLSETEKDVVLTLIPQEKTAEVLSLAREQFHLVHPGQGILFTLPLTGVSGQIPQVLCKPEYKKESKVSSMAETTAEYSLIVTLLNRGYTDTVMEAARAAGATGGTALHARRVGYEDGENFLGFTLQPEKEMLLILTRREQKRALLQAINTAAGLTTPCRGVVFALPVDDIVGLAAIEGQGEL